MGNRIMAVADGDYIMLPWGQFEFHNNETITKTNVNDPSGASWVGANGCKLSWKNDQGEEMVLLQMRRNQDGDGEYYLGCLDSARYAQLKAAGDHNALDHAMIEVATITPKGVEFRVPVKFSAGATGCAASNPDTIWAPDGLSFTQQQNDKNFVTYKVDTPYDKGSNPVALWASGTNQ